MEVIPLAHPSARTSTRRWASSVGQRSGRQRDQVGVYLAVGGAVDDDLDDPDAVRGLRDGGRERGGTSDPLVPDAVRPAECREVRSRRRPEDPLEVVGTLGGPVLQRREDPSPVVVDDDEGEVRGRFRRAGERSSSSGAMRNPTSACLSGLPAALSVALTPTSIAGRRMKVPIATPVGAKGSSSSDLVARHPADRRFLLGRSRAGQSRADALRACRAGERRPDRAAGGGLLRLRHCRPRNRREPRRPATGAG